VLRGAVLPAGFWRSPSAPGAVLLEPLMSSVPPVAVVALAPPLALVLPLVFLWSAAQPASASPHSAIQISLVMKYLRKKGLLSSQGSFLKNRENRGQSPISVSCASLEIGL
jgi:hypothetical protein